MTSWLSQTKGEAVGYDNLRTLYVGAHFVVTIDLKIIGFNAIELLSSENIFLLTKVLRYHKHLTSTSLVAVGDITIWKLLDILVKTKNVKIFHEVMT